jgi:hypothetical protein
MATMESQIVGWRRTKTWCNSLWVSFFASRQSLTLRKELLGMRTFG